MNQTQEQKPVPKEQIVEAHGFVFCITLDNGDLLNATLTVRDGLRPVFFTLKGYTYGGTKAVAEHLLGMSSDVNRLYEEAKRIDAGLVSVSSLYYASRYSMQRDGTRGR